MRVRRPAVAGTFYPAKKEELLKSIEDCFLHPVGPGRKPPTPNEGKIAGLVCPHAGYIYSGPVAAHSYLQASALRPDVIVIIGPNHYGIGSGVATMKEGTWETPLGHVDVSGSAAEQVVKAAGIMDFDDAAHSEDHCLEVQIPMLQFIYSHRFEILPIILRMQDKETAIEVGKALAQLARDRNVLLIASSDLTHYEPHEQAVKKDKGLIQTILEMDVSRFYGVLERLNVTACGYGAIASVMTAAKMLGAEKGELLKYATSGDTSGDKKAVVGYSSIVFT